MNVSAVAKLFAQRIGYKRTNFLLYGSRVPAHENFVFPIVGYFVSNDMPTTFI